jgi:S1-C subfamily serine protease
MTCAEAAQPSDSLEIRLSTGERIGARFLGQDAALGASLIRVDRADALVPMPRLTRPPCQRGKWVLVLNFTAADGKPDLRLGTLESIVPAAQGSREYLRVSLPDCRGTCGGALVDGHGRFRGMVLDVRAEQEGEIGSSSQVDYADLLQCDTVQALSFAELLGLADTLQASSAHAVGFLGIHAEVGDDFSSPDESAGKHGARMLHVVRVLPGGPAELAGIMAGDEILEIGGHPVRETDEITRRVAVLKPGTEVQVKVLRRGVPLVFTPRLVDRSSLEWLLRENELNATRQKRIRRSIQQLENRLQELEQERSRFQ